MQKYRYSLNLQLFSEEGTVDTGVETASDAGMPEIEQSADQPGVETQAAAEPEKQNNFEKAFAKRLADAQAKWEAEASEKYKDYDVLKKTANYFQQRHGYGSLMTMKEDIELAELQDRAARENLTVEELQRRQELEDLKAWKNEIEQQQQQQQWQQTYFSGLNEFVKDRGVEAEKLNQFMIENEFTVNPQDMNKSFELAYKAMKYDDVVKQSEEAEKNGMKKLLQAKGSIPTVPGNNAQGQVVRPPAKTWAEARARAYQRGAE